MRYALVPNRASHKVLFWERLLPAAALGVSEGGTEAGLIWMKLHFLTKRNYGRLDVFLITEVYPERA